MLFSVILFDLDGTLTDPKPGITGCIQYALSELGYKPPDADELHWCIGPPLKDSFSQLLNTLDSKVIEQAILLYRRRFATIGLFENSLYPQISEVLKAIHFGDYKTFVATSKPYIYATQIIEHFRLIPFLCEAAPNPLKFFLSLCPTLREATSCLCVLCGSFFFLVLKAHLHTELV
ncbi:HAD hydrolase-like protein [Nostoc sp. ChiVER01]|uniref:HAD hydrolase-like protein n=1 Tax=Nostoc sp. ChiVER01 TaxID=3075382 RepID=UPI002AD31C89|nr:HAD hydrolase-like protein [Nostoc sp. ChiVER01]MDZ8225181.1 HAD hydrolase-like protein [Nostoc sp. ChiVER01]